ncbi:MAG TPA: sigma-70 family RNA polymerase sigma factor [Planctomycetota bacterium]|jgi:RNA polymerase sigma-70 factor (ECF subfamily)|nr:sigma-70 family RNA polymerase sigma factor [Planctomycetota bacterium]
MTAPIPRSADPRLAGAEELSAQTRWLRALARTLVADGNLADDLVQDTWLAALRRPASSPEEGAQRGPVRAWLATVLRRRVAERRRESASRAARERSSARREELPSTLEMVERAAVQRDLVQAVLDLDEPYRTTILWRYFEELPPREIARRAGVPVATVYSRIARGIARLRERLDRARGGDGRSWAIALLPVLEAPGSGPAWIGALLVKTSTQIAIATACAAAVVAAIVLWTSHGTVPAPEPARAELAAREPAPSQEAEPRRGPAVDLADAEPGRRRTDGADASARRPDAARAAAPAPARTLRGEVLDLMGGPLAGVALAFSPAAPQPIRSGTDGRFEVPLPATAETVLSADPRWATVLAGSAKIAPATLSIVVVAARLDLAGAVVDEDGQPLLGAELAVRVPRSFGADFGRPLDGCVERTWRSVSDAAGAFTLADVPAIPSAALHASLGGFEEHVEPLPASSDRGMRIVLRRPRASTGRLAGIVVDANGGLVPGARVSAGWESTFTDNSGRFELDVAKDPVPARVTAVKSGSLPAVQDATKNASGGLAWPEEVVLRLGASPRTISGRVLDGEGAPVHGARVWLSDPTYFGLVEREPVQVETLLGRKDAPFWAYVTTSGDGSFEITGLLERAYKLCALDPETLLAATSAPVEAGDRGVEIRLAKDALRERVAGRVVARDGTPVVGASVVLQRFAFSVGFPGGGTRDEFADRPEEKTDADGRFEIRRVPKEGAELFVHGEEILFWSMQLDEKTPADDLKIVVNRRMHLQIELDEPFDRADSLAVLDADGAPMILRIMRGETSFTSRKADIVQGRSQVLSTAEDARTVVFSKAGVEVARVPVELRAGEVRTVRY